MLEPAPRNGGAVPRSRLRIKSENGSEEDPAFRVSCEDSATDFPNSSDYLGRGKLTRQDPTSHRIIEKRRRDRMNNCLADLSRLIPPDYLKKGRGRIEKTEIIEMATRYIKYLQDGRNCVEKQENSAMDHFSLGYQECISEVLRYLVEKQGHFPSDAICVQLINHLQLHCGNLTKGDILLTQTSNPDSSSTGSSTGYPAHIQSNRNAQHLKEKNIDTNNSERHHKHSNLYTAQNDGKQYNFMVDVEHSQQVISENINDVSQNGSIGDHQRLFQQQNMSLMSNNNFAALKVSENNKKEAVSTRSNFIRNILYQDDYRSSQEPRINNGFTSLSPFHSQHNMNSESSLRNVRKTDSSQPNDNVLIMNGNEADNIHSYKFKNTIKQRFSQSQSTDYSSSSPSDGVTNVGSSSSTDPSLPGREQFHGNSKFTHKRRKVSDHNRHINNNYDQSSSSGTNSSETVPTKIQNSSYRVNKLQDSKDPSNDIKGSQLTNGRINGKSSDGSENEENFPRGLSSSVGVPIFALHAKGSFYVPMNVDYDCLIPFLGQYDLLDVNTFQPNLSLHPVTINVNFQPLYLNNKHLQPVRTKTERKGWQ